MIVPETAVYKDLPSTYTITQEFHPPSMIPCVTKAKEFLSHYTAHFKT